MKKESAIEIEMWIVIQHKFKKVGNNEKDKATKVAKVVDKKK